MAADQLRASRRASFPNLHLLSHTPNLLFSLQLLVWILSLSLFFFVYSVDSWKNPIWHKFRVQLSSLLRIIAREWKRRYRENLTILFPFFLHPKHTLLPFSRFLLNRPFEGKGWRREWERFTGESGRSVIRPGGVIGWMQLSYNPQPLSQLVMSRDGGELECEREGKRREEKRREGSLLRRRCLYYLPTLERWLQSASRDNDRS